VGAPFLVRRKCFLYYRIPGGGTCADVGESGGDCLGVFLQ